MLQQINKTKTRNYYIVDSNEMNTTESIEPTVWYFCNRFDIGFEIQNEIEADVVDQCNNEIETARKSKWNVVTVA